jgi:hypothetical protein
MSEEKGVYFRFLNRNVQVNPRLQSTDKNNTFFCFKMMFLYPSCPLSFALFLDQPHAVSLQQTMQQKSSFIPRKEC